MKRSAFLLFFVVALMVSFAAPLAFAKKAKSKAAEFLQVMSADPNANTITVADNNGKNAATYSVTSVTVILVNDQPAKLVDLKKGMHVNISLIEGGRAVSKIDSLSATAARKKTS